MRKTFAIAAGVAFGFVGPWLVVWLILSAGTLTISDIRDWNEGGRMLTMMCSLFMAFPGGFLASAIYGDLTRG